jgi:hypothetical protein
MERKITELADLIEKMLNVNPGKRLTPLQALEHAYFQTNIKGEVVKKVRVVEGRAE